MPKIDLTKESFKAKGKTYKIYSTLSIARFIEFEKLQAEVGFGFTFDQFFNKLKDTYEALNKGKLADAAVKVHNMLTGIADKIDRRKHPVLMLCALFICEEKEDRSKYDEKVMTQKIQDWQEEGLEIQDFFTLAFNFVSGFIPAYNEISQSISSQKKEKNATSGKSKST